MNTDNNQRKTDDNQQKVHENSRNKAERENASPAFDSQHSGDANGGMEPGKDPDTKENNDSRK